jgi:hypothetical protein
MSAEKIRNHNNHFFKKQEKLKEEKIESALFGLQRLEIIKGFKNRIHLDGNGGESLEINLIVYPNWNGKVFFRTGNGHNLESLQKADEYGVYYLGVSNETTRVNIKTTIMEILVIEMEKRGIKNNIAH